MKRVICDFDNTGKKIKPQHNLCNYPPKFRRAFTGAPDEEGAELYNRLLNEINPTMTRIRDPKHAGYGKAGNICAIFRDERKDREKPENYFFAFTDTLVKTTREACPDFIYQLGMPREQYDNYYTAWTDPEMYADICEHIVRHYNDGWAKGFHYGIKYWEIWGRPDDPHCFHGSREDYFKLYAAAATRLKKLHPRLKIGGPCIADATGDNGYFREFLAYVKENGLPLDFVTFAVYEEKIDKALEAARNIKKAMREAGLKAEIICAEWNCLTLDEKGMFCVPHARDEYGAAYDAAFMIKMEQLGIKQSLFFDCQHCTPWGSLIYPCFFKPEKPLWAINSFAKVYDLQTSVKTKTVGRDIFALASKNGKKKALLIACTAQKKSRLEIEGFPGAKTVKLLDRDNDMQEVFSGKDEKITLDIKPNTVLLIESK